LRNNIEVGKKMTFQYVKYLSAIPANLCFDT
jgi:hypothetical protein